MPYCYKCKRNKPDNDFYPSFLRTKRKTGKCKACDKEYLKNRKNRHSKDPAKKHFRNDWSRRNTEYKKTHGQRMGVVRRVQMMQSVGTISAAQQRALFMSANYRCLKCGCLPTDSNPLTIDHIVPLALGGENTIENAQVLCRSCNSSKGASVADYRASPVLPIDQLELPFWDDKEAA